MVSSGSAANVQIGEPLRSQPQSRGFWTTSNRAQYAIYALALAVSISTWFIEIHAPLRLDETASYWQISKGFSEILSRQGSLSFPAYSYILWLSTKLIGTSEIALRVPSILAMLGAVYLLYLGARELFERDIAFIAAVIFCLHPIVVFASIDVRPYAFGMLATNSAILILFRLRRSNSNWLAALFGLTAACIVWFQYLSISILPALVLCFFAIKNCDRKTLWRQFGVALAGFALAFLPLIPGLINMFRTSGTHVYESAPNLWDLGWTLAPGWLLTVFCGTGLFAFLVFAARQRRYLFNRPEGWHLVLCACLALIPILILYGVSVGTSIHTFVYYHRLDAIPGIALCWALALSHFRSRNLRLLFCVAIVAATAFLPLNSPLSRVRKNSMKYPIELAERSAAIDGATVVMCSSFVESNYVAMPSMESVKESRYFAPLSYYRLSAPVLPLPQLINDETVQIGSRFLREAARKHKRFLVFADRTNSYKILVWFANNAAATHSVRKLGQFDDGVEVLEFVPRNNLTPRTEK